MTQAILATVTADTTATRTIWPSFQGFITCAAHKYPASVRSTALAYIAKAAIMHDVRTHAMNHVIEDLVVELETEQIDYRSNFPVLYDDVEIAPRFNLSFMGRASDWGDLDILKHLLEILAPQIPPIRSCLKCAG